MSCQVIQVGTTAAAKSDLEKIADELVQRRLAACVQIGGPMTSRYWWQGKVETAEEWWCVIKTTRDKYDRVEETIRRLHPYDVPDILATPVESGNPDYLKWVADEAAG